MYRKNVGIILLNSKNEILLCNRKDIQKVWQAPQGGIEESESYLDAAKRELYEETHIHSTECSILFTYPFWIYYEFPQKIIYDDGVKYQGQVQKWIFIRKNNDKLIQEETNEFKKYKWSHPDNILQQIVPFKQKSYKTALHFLSKKLEAKP